MTHDDAFDAGPNRRMLLALVAGTVAASIVAVRGRAAEPKRIGVIGAGNVGSAIGELWIAAGHRVMFASRHPEELRPMAAALGERASVGTAAEAAAFGDAALLAVPYGAYAQIGRDLAGVWKGKVVLDAGNAVAGRDGPELRERAGRIGIGALSAELLPGVRLVRVFSNLGAARFRAGHHRKPEPIGLPIAGDDPEALRIAEALVRDAGFEPLVVGGLDRARLFQQGEPFWTASKDELPARALKAKLDELTR